MQIDLTQDEINLIATMFSNANTSLLAQTSIATCTLAQSIVAKFQQAVTTPKGD